MPVEFDEQLANIADRCIELIIDHNVNSVK